MRRRCGLTGIDPAAGAPRAAGGRYAVLWSGGKDSCLALWKARQSGVPVAGLVNLVDGATGRVRFHAVRGGLIERQAAALGLELLQVPTAPDAYQEGFSAALDELRERGYTGLVGGDIHLRDVRAWAQARAEEAGLELIEPLWERGGAELLHELVDAGFRAVLTCCDASRLEDGWLGREIDDAFIAEILPLEGVDPCGEQGEYHSFVFDGPLFAAPVEWRPGEVRRTGAFLQLDLVPAEAA